MKYYIIYKEEYPWDVRVEKIARSLLVRGHNVTILARNLRQEEATAEMGTLRIHRLPNTAKFPKIIQIMVNLALFFNPFWLYGIYKSTYRREKSVIIVRDLPLMLAGVLIAKMKNKALVFDMAECYPEMYASMRDYPDRFLLANFLKNQYIAALYEKQVCKLVDHIFVVVEESKRRLEAKGIPSNKITIVSNTPMIFEDKKQTKKHCGCFLRIIYVGFLTRIRGIDILIKSVHKYINKYESKEIHVDIIGEGSIKKELSSLVNELKLGSVVTLHGWLGKQEVDRLMSNANVGALTYRVCRHWNNTIPNKIFDYMKSGLPVLATEVVPIERILHETNSGLICRDQDIEDIAAKLIELRNPEIRERLGNNGIKAVKEKFNWNVDSQRMVVALEQLRNG
jgi:glycosyltransferase involved in cell wall biosynthesis